MAKFDEHYSEDLLKGRMAECLVEELLKQGGNKVYRFGYESILQNLTQIGEYPSIDKRELVSRKLKSIPDFVVVNRRKKPFFVEIKFRTKVKVYERDLKPIEEFWQAKVIMVTIKKPYFRVLDTISKERNWISLVKDKDLGITEKLLEEFNRLVEKYYPNAKEAS